MTTRALVLVRFLALATGLKMKTGYLLLAVMCSVAAFGQQPVPGPTAFPVAPPSAPAQRSDSDLEKLVAPIALYPDPLIAVMLPAAAYPVEIVMAARFVANANNLEAIDDQPWDENVRAVARFPSVIQFMSDELPWTAELGEAFAEQPLDLMDAIQTLRAKAQSVGTLQTTPEQVVIVTNAVVERIFETQLVYVTNTIVQIVPSDPQVIFVPVYNPTIVFAPPPTYVFVAPPITFRPGIRVGVGGAFGNRHVNWFYGGVFYGPGSFPFWAWGPNPYFPPHPGFRPPPFRPGPGWRPPPPGNRPPVRPPSRPPPGVRPPQRPPERPVTGPEPIPRPDWNRPRPRPPITDEDRGWSTSTRPGRPPGRPGTRPGFNEGGIRPTPLPENIRPGPGETRPGLGGRPGGGRPGGTERPGPGVSGRPTPGRGPSSGSGLDDMGSGGESRDFSRRGASSRGNSGGPRGNRDGSRRDGNRE